MAANEIFEAKTPDDFCTARSLVEQYAWSLAFDLDFQDFAGELKNLPGDYAPPGGCIFLARDNDRIIGCAALRKLEETICEMKRLYVVPEARGRGVGRMLAESVIARAKQLGYARMRLDTLSSMPTANHLYSILGFRRIAPYRYNPLEGAEFYELSL